MLIARGASSAIPEEAQTFILELLGQLADSDPIGLPGVGAIGSLPRAGVQAGQRAARNLAGKVFDEVPGRSGVVPRPEVMDKLARLEEQVGPQSELMKMLMMMLDGQTLARTFKGGADSGILERGLQQSARTKTAKTLSKGAAAVGVGKKAENELPIRDEVNRPEADTTNILDALIELATRKIGGR